MKFEFRVDAADASSNLTSLAARSGALAVPLKIIGELLETGLTRNVGTEGGYLGGPWGSLDEGTQMRKAREGLPDEPLRATGEMLAALEGGEGSVMKMTPQTVRVGIEPSLFRARFHMAQNRALLGVTPADELAAVTILHEWIEGTRG